MSIPKEMKAVYYTAPKTFSVTDRPVPQPNDDEVLTKIKISGVCGTDQHIHEGEFISKFPLCPGHEAVGEVVSIGKNVKNVKVGDRVVCDTNSACQTCYFCVRGKPLFCENLMCQGVNFDGGFAEYAKWHFSKVYPIKNLTDLEACLVEPASCALHGADVLNLAVGSEVLVIGAGPTGLLLSQLLRQNGASKLVLAANAGPKMKIAREIEAADHFVDLDRKNPEAQWKQLMEDHPYGFDAVVEATGVASIATNAINYVKKGGALLIYGVYSKKDTVTWSPEMIFSKELRILGSFSQINCFPRAVAYLDNKKVRTAEMVTDVFKLEQFQDALDKIASRNCLKVAIAPGEYSKP